MEQEYNDFPDEVEVYLDKLDDKERSHFDKGYLVALLSICEQISDSRCKLLNKLLDMEKGRHRDQLLAKLHVLDMYEEHYKKRIDILEPHLTEYE